MLYPFGEAQTETQCNPNSENINDCYNQNVVTRRRNSGSSSGNKNITNKILPNTNESTINSNNDGTADVCENSQNVESDISINSNNSLVLTKANEIGHDSSNYYRNRRHGRRKISPQIDGNESYTGSSRSTRSTSSSGSTCSASSCEGDSSTSSGQPNLLYPGFPEVSLRYLTQDMRPRNWCLRLITNPWFERVSILVILLNCITLGMYQPCVDDACVTNRCKILQIFDDIIFIFFSLEMTIKMVAMGVYGRHTYLADSWNRLDFFIVLAGAFEYCLNMENLNLTAIRTIRVLRPLRAINRIPSMRILVMLLLDTLPMLGNVLLLCFFVFFIFGIVGVQLWEGILRQRCVLQLPDHVSAPNISFYYEFSKEQDYICSKPEDSGMHLCTELPQYRVGPMLCNASAIPNIANNPTNSSCVNWNQYYKNCTQLGGNPFQGTISFDNIGLAWVAIFLVISLEGWTDIMYYVQDAHSFWDWIYFVLLIVIGSFFMINLCLVVIATQFSETKKREMERMRQERARYTSTSTLASSTNNSEPATCYAEIVKYIAHIWRRTKRRLIKKLRMYKYQRQQQREEGLIPNAETLTLSPSRIKCHHPKCPLKSSKPSNIPDQLITVMVPLTTNATISGNESQISSPDITDSGDMVKNFKLFNNNHDIKDDKQKTILLKIPTSTESEQLINPCTSGFLSPPTSARRRSSVMFNEYVILHTPPSISETTSDKNVCSSEKMTQTGDGNIWQVNLPQNIGPNSISNVFADCSDLSLNDALTCQELLAFSVAFSAALPTSQSTLDTFYSSLTRGTHVHNLANEKPQNIVTQNSNYNEDFSCCYDLYQNVGNRTDKSDSATSKNKIYITVVTVYKLIEKIFGVVRKYIKALVEHKYFQQGILLAILINTLSMGIEYHGQPQELTSIIELSNIIFSGIFAVEMVLKVIAEGPFRYIANGFNVFDGVIVILSVFELAQQFFGVGDGNSGLSVLRTFRLLRILKLVRFMPNLRRQLFVMLRTMDNVAVFFSLLILFIFIFSILGMYLFGGKFCKFTDDLGQERECTCPEIVAKHPQCECDRKHFNNFLWATVTVFQILTQEDWNVVLFNGMEKTSHWAALYFVALMTFGNYVLFNLLVAILVEGFSSERNERREREQRELVKKLREENEKLDELLYDEGRSCSDSTTTSDSYHEIKNKWHSAEDIHKDPKCNIQKQRLLQPKNHQYPVDDLNPDTEHTIKYKRHSDKDIDKLSCDGKFVKKAQSIRERRFDAKKLQNIKYQIQEPPLITTTAATPQDSPNTTLGNGSSFKNWDDLNLDKLDERCPSFPLLLKPPSIVGSFKAINESCNQERSHSTKMLLHIEPSITTPNRLNITENGITLKQSSTSIPTATAKQLSPSDENYDASAKSINSVSSEIPEATSQIHRNSSFKKFSRSSLKKKKSKTKSESDSGEIVILNNGRDHSQHNFGSNVGTPNQMGSNWRTENPIQTPYRIQNDTKDTNKLSPQNSIRRCSVVRRGSSFLNYTQQQLLYQHLQNRRNSIKNHPMVNYRRRMSSIEQVFEKPSNINLCNLETTAKANELLKSKIDSDKTQNSINHINVHEYDIENIQSEAAKRIHRLKDMARQFTEEREEYSLYIFSEQNRFRLICTWFVNQKWFDNVILLFIGLNCITLAMERPNIPPNCTERYFLATANYVFTVVFTIEMFIKVVAAGMFYGNDAYFNSGWNIMDGSLVIISIIDLLMSLVSDSSPRIFGILRVFRLLRSLRPLRVINRAPGLKLVVQTLLSSLRPIGNIVLICCTFFIIFGILGVQLFKGTFFFCEGISVKDVKNKTDCLSIHGNMWINRKYNFDDLGKALMSLFVLSSRDGWVNIMYTGLDAVGVDQQPIVNYNEWRLLYFIAFILLVGFFVLNMFVGVVVENFHRCREEQEKEEKIRRAAKRALQMEKKRRRMHEPPYYTNYSSIRLFVHNVVTSKYFDLAIAAVIGLNVVTMALEYHMMPIALEYALKIFNYFFTAVFILEAFMKLLALGFKIYMKDKWNKLDVGIVILSIVGIVLEELETNIIPINPTIIRVMRVLRIARVLKLLKMAKGIRALLDTVMQALPQVGNLGLLFFLLFFIFAALGVELFGRLECSDNYPCQGLGEHAHFANFGMAFLTLFRVATGDNWNGIMKDTLRDDCDDAADCVQNCCVSSVIAPIFFVIFVLMAQFVLVNVVVAVLMKHLEESHKQMEDEIDMDTELEREFQQAQEFEEEQALCSQLQEEDTVAQKRPLAKVLSLPSNFTYTTPVFEKKFNTARRQTLHYLNSSVRLSDASQRSEMFSEKNSISEVAENSGANECEQNSFSKEINSLSDLPDPNRTSRSRPKLGKEISLDESAMSGSVFRHPRIEKKRMSCDNLPWKIEKNLNCYQRSKFTGRIRPPSTSTETFVNEQYDKNIQSVTNADKQQPRDGTDLKELKFVQTQSLDVANSGSKSYLSVPKLQPSRSRSGSCKQLFKQHAMDEEHDIDENSLLLPTVNKIQISSTKPSGSLMVPEQKDKKYLSVNVEPERCESIRKSDSSEILRIISERRMMERRDTMKSTSNAETFDYDQLFIEHSPQTSKTEK